MKSNMKKTSILGTHMYIKREGLAKSIDEWEKEGKSVKDIRIKQTDRRGGILPERVR